MAIKETIYLHRKHRVCIGNSGAQKMWNRYSFWTHASDVEFDDGSTLDSKISNIKGITKNIDAGAGYAADVSLVKSIRDSLKSLIDNLSNVVNNINNRLGGLRFYEDSNGKWVVGADSVPKKLGSGLEGLKENVLYSIPLTKWKRTNYQIDSEQRFWGGCSSFDLKAFFQNDYDKLVFGENCIVSVDGMYSDQDNNLVGNSFSTMIPLCNMANISNPIDYNTIVGNKYSEYRSHLPSISKFKRPSAGGGFNYDILGRELYAFALYYPQNGEMLVFTSQNYHVSSIAVSIAE